MTLTDFADGIVPAVAFNFKVPPEQVNQIRAWIAQGLIRTDDPSPSATDSLWFLAPPKVDKSRWPYKVGLLARASGIPKNHHDLHGGFNQERDGGKLVVGSECHQLWLAGWEAGK